VGKYAAAFIAAAALFHRGESQQAFELFCGSSASPVQGLFSYCRWAPLAHEGGARWGLVRAGAVPLAPAAAASKQRLSDWLALRNALAAPAAGVWTMCGSRTPMWQQRSR
jgi:hypothetical protein